MSWRGKTHIFRAFLAKLVINPQIVARYGRSQAGIWALVSGDMGRRERAYGAARGRLFRLVFNINQAECLEEAGG